MLNFGHRSLNKRHVGIDQNVYGNVSDLKLNAFRKCCKAIYFPISKTVSTKLTKPAFETLLNPSTQSDTQVYISMQNKIK